MKPLAAGTASSCLTWLLAFALLSACLCPTATALATFSSTVRADFVARTLEPYLCPEGSAAEILTFQTFSRDEYGSASPATGFEMQCVDAAGVVTRPPNPDYAFYWIGLLALASLVVSGLLAIVLAAPVGALIARWAARRRAAAGP